MEVETETRVLVPLKRDHTSGDQVEAEADASKKRKMSPDVEEEETEEYEMYWDDSWWSCVDPAEEDSELLMDPNAFQARMYRESWDYYYSGSYGSFEAETTIPSKRFTDSEDGKGASTLQIFSAKVIAIRGGLQWPIDVYGTVAIRDPLDYNRNTIFHRDRDNCQTLTPQDPSLVLTGPIRAVMASDHVIFDADLKVKGNVESEDKMLSFLAARCIIQDTETYLIKREYISKLSKLEFTLGFILRSAEATIDMRVTDGTWPDGVYGKFVARIDRIKDEQVVLFDSGDGRKVRVDGNNDISLSRSVVSVDVRGELILSVETWRQGTNNGEVSLTKEEKSFEAFEMGRSLGEIDVGFCKIGITVAWSLFCPHPRRMHLDLYKKKSVV